jgi:hypothetical protein
MISKPGFDIARRVKALFKQSAKSFLGRGSPERSGKSLPFWRNFGVLRQAIQVNQALRLCDCLLVKRCNSCREGVLSIEPEVRKKRN